jgi:hypothetical protein
MDKEKEYKYICKECWNYVYIKNKNIDVFCCKKQMKREK